MAMWLKVSILIFALLSFIIALILVTANSSLNRELNSLLANQASVAVVSETSTVNFSTFTNLPEPVARYLRNVLTDGQAVIHRATFQQSGNLTVEPNTETWSPFKATHYAFPLTKAFIWDAKINIFPLLHVRVRDSYYNGIGEGKVSLLSAMSLGHDKDNSALNSAALYRYLAEAPWYPTALLPEAGISWVAQDDKTAIAHLADSGITISLEFRFNDRNEISGIYTEDRFGKFGNTYIQYPWEGKFNDYKDYSGMKIPTEAEVGWHLPDGFWLFWKGEILTANYSFKNN